MMSGYEESLYSRAEMLAETSDLAAEATEVLDGASGAGVDPAAVTSLRAAVQFLDPAEGAPAYQAERPGDGYHSDVEFLEAIVDAEDQVRERLRDADKLRGDAGEAMDKAQDDLGRSRRDLQNAQMALAAAMALPTKNPCDGCHPAKAAAIQQAEQEVADAEQAIADASRRISTLGGALEILDELIRRLTAAAQALHRVPHDLGETYELIANFIRDGGKMTHDGRWITGDGDMPVGGRRPKDQGRLRNARNDHDDRSSMNGTPPVNGTQLRFGKLPMVWLPESPAPASQWPQQEVPAELPREAEDTPAEPIKLPFSLNRGQKTLAIAILTLALAVTPVFFLVMFLTVNGMLGPYFDGWAWTVPVATEATFLLLFLWAVFMEWVRKPKRLLWIAPYPFAGMSAFLNVWASHGSIPGMAGHLAVTLAFFIPVTFAKTGVRSLITTEEQRARATALADAQAHARDMLRSALGRFWKWRAPILLRRQLRSGRLPARVLEAVNTGNATEWEPAVETWIAAAVALPERTAEVLRAARAEASRSTPASTPEATPEDAPEPVSSAAPDTPAAVPEARPRARFAHASKPALKLTAARSRSMSPDKLADHVEAMLDANGGTVSVNKIKTDLSVGTDKANKALEIARRNRARVVPIGERRQA
jgi:hypothetical protein